MPSKLFYAFFTLALIANLNSTAQNRYLIRFKDKGSNTFTLANPAAYLNQRSLDRRTRYAIAIDSTDLPVSASYVQALRAIPNVTVLNVSKWLNQVSIFTTDPTALTLINALPFVRSSQAIAARAVTTRLVDKSESNGLPITQKTTDTQGDFYNYGLTYAQVHLHNGEFLHNIGLRGQQVVIGVLDVGFFQYTSLRSFDSVNRNGQVLGTYDFVDGETNVADNNAHGMQCFSAIAGNIPGEFVGTAPKASFYLFRSEDAGSEYPIEEHNWVCAAERLDSAGGDVISSSLGYTQFDNPAYNHTYADMNGNTTIAAIGADLAAKKGILVFNAVGNDGDKPWKYLGTPADGDSVVAVGAVTSSGAVGAFSSYGPSSDGQVKPDVASVGVGTYLQGTNNTIVTNNGTSFACPNMAGLATCLWQGFPEYNNMKIAATLRQAGSNVTTPNDRIGYGIPDMKKAVLLLLKEGATSTTTLNGCQPVVTWSSKDVTSMRYEIERKSAGEAGFTRIATLAAKGGVFSRQQYSFTDATPITTAGVTSYRIRQVIDTAVASLSADYIDTVTVSVLPSCTFNQVVITPNPVTTAFNLVITYPEAMPQLHIRITNALGQVVKQLTYNKAAGALTIPISATGWALGKYTASVYTSNNLLSNQEFLKLQ